MNYKVNEIGMAEKNERPTSLTKDVGIHIGIRRTLPVIIEDVWQLLTTREGLIFGWVKRITMISIKAESINLSMSQ